MARTREEHLAAKRAWEKNKKASDPEYKRRQLEASKAAHAREAPEITEQQRQRNNERRNFMRATDKGYRSWELKRDRTARKELVKSRKAAGLCMTCAKLRGDSQSDSYCQPCYTKLQDVVMKRYYEAQAKVFAHYGTKCACPGGCDITAPRFLAIDHIGGWKKVHPERKTRPSLMSFYNWIIANNFPNTVRVLCHNCNFATRFNEPCHHETVLAELNELVALEDNRGSV